MRCEAGIGTRELARRLGVDHSKIVRIEQGIQRVSLGEFCLWCETSDVDAGQVIGRLSEI